MIENLLGGGGGGGTVDTITAGTGISVNSTDPANPIITNTSLNTDEVAKVSSNDTTAGYLNGKLVAGTNITFTENNNGGNETLTIAAAGDTTYAVTLADAENTTSQITLAQFTIPANTWSQGEEVVLDLHCLSLNSTGNIQNVTYVVGGTTITDQTSGTVSAGGVPLTAGFGRVRLRFVRVGTGVAYTFIANNSPTTTSFYFDGPAPPLWQNIATFYDSSVTFSSNITIYVKATLGLASANYYIRTEHARAYKVPVGSL